MILTSKIYLRSIALAGYKSYNNDLTKNKIKLQGINVITGSNSTGKSDLISFLNMTSFMMVRSLMTFALKQGGVQSLLHPSSQIGQIQGELVFCDSNKEDMTYTFDLEKNELNQLRFSKEHTSYLTNEKDFGTNHLESNLADSMELVDCELKQCLTQLNICYCDSINPYVCNTTHRDSDLHLYSNGSNIAAILYRMMRNPNTYIYYTRILHYIRMVFPKFFEFILQPELNKELQLKWKQVGSEQVYNAYQLSDEMLHFIILTTLLLQPPKTAPTIIILDEPRTSLSPYATDVLIQEIYMASQVSQIIITTQSPTLLSRFSQENIIRVKYDYDNQCSILKER